MRLVAASLELNTLSLELGKQYLSATLLLVSVKR